METSSARLETMTTSTTVDISAAVSSSRMANGAYSVVRLQQQQHDSNATCLLAPS
ncbi:hypothetical protein CGMCC3_g17763 [Colletotrichum fructicola]|nr:uncharacterized protein CGMCC3_g17763 [Colletotrichum fructicola]KAE9566065.1 hypothetical protein CGMCC3_g17763 [Colletotrichum fructicola]